MPFVVELQLLRKVLDFATAYLLWRTLSRESRQLSERAIKLSQTAEYLKLDASSTMRAILKLTAYARVLRVGVKVLANLRT